MKLYIDFEGQFPQLIEVAILMVEEDSPTRVFHRIIRPPIMPLDDCSARFCHCIPTWYVGKKGVPEEYVLYELSWYLGKFPRPLTICGYGDDVKESFLKSWLRDVDFTGISFAQVNLAPWKERDLLPSHQQATLLRHSVGYEYCSAHRLLLNAKTLERQKHGPHCAFIDVLELFMVDTGKMVTSETVHALDWL